MNIIKLHSRVDLYLDNTRGARFQRWEYDNAVNDAVQNFIDSILNPDEAIKKVNGFQSDQYISDNLYTLQKLQTAAPTADVALFPTDYQYLTSLLATIGGVQYYCRPTTINKLGPLLLDSYRKPSDIKPYYVQTTTGFKVYHGSGTISSCDLNYIKTPATVYSGKTSQLISAGVAVLTNAAVYIFVEPGTFNGTAYDIGDEFTCAATTTLASGTVILKSLVTDCDLPGKTHELIAKSAAQIMLKITANYPASQAIDSEAQKS